jgi:hypothetical protein
MAQMFQSETVLIGSMSTDWTSVEELGLKDTGPLKTGPLNSVWLE